MPAEELWGVAHLLSDALGRLHGTAVVEPTRHVEPLAGVEPAGTGAAFGCRADELELSDPVPGLADPGRQPPPGSDVELFGELGGQRSGEHHQSDHQAGTPGRQDRPTIAAASSPRLSNGENALPRWRLRLPARNAEQVRAAVASFLAADPRVLRQPEPVLHSHTDTIEIECSLLPGLLDGEREHLRAALQRLLASD